VTPVKAPLCAGSRQLVSPRVASRWCNALTLQPKQALPVCNSRCTPAVCRWPVRGPAQVVCPFPSFFVGPD